MIPIFKLITYTFVVINIGNTISADDVITSSENEMDLVIDMLLKNEIHEYNDYDSVENVIEKDTTAEIPQYADGVWKCGKCEDIDESSPAYTETYNVEAKNENENLVHLQFGFLLEDMSCMIVTASKDSDLNRVRRLSGDCAGDVTLSVTGAAQYEVKVYK